MIGRCGTRVMPLYSLPGFIPGVIIIHLRATSFWLPARATMPNIHVANCKEGLPLPPCANFEPDLLWKKEKKRWSSTITAEESVAAVQRWRDRESVMCLAWIQQVVMWFLSVCMGLLRLQSFGKKKVSYAWNGG